MSNLFAKSARVYGGNPSGDVSVQGGQTFSPTNQAVTEVLVPGTYRRAVPGPVRNGHYALHCVLDTPGGATSALTVWYSNLPNPSVASDADWVQDTTIGSLALDTAGNKFINVANINADWVMYKAVVVTSNCSMRLVHRAEGIHNGGF
jgi:hypothetical protein